MLHLSRYRPLFLKLASRASSNSRPAFCSVSAESVLLVNRAGESLGVKSFVDAQTLAKQDGLELKIVNKAVSPPIAKMCPAQTQPSEKQNIDSILLVDDADVSLGVKSMIDARSLAADKGFVLTYVDKNSSPPVMKMHPFEEEKSPEKVSDSILLIDSTGKSMGVKSLADAKKLAAESRLVLASVNSKAKPPVMKLLNNEDIPQVKKRKVKTPRKTKPPAQRKCKEMNLSSRTEQHDYKTKMRQMKNFLMANNELKISLIAKKRWKSSERSMAEGGSLIALKTRICDELAHISQPHGSVSDMGWRLSFRLMPKSSKS